MLLATIAALLPHLGWAALPWVAVWSWFSFCGHPISNCNWNWTGTDSNWPTQAVCGTWLYNYYPSTCFLWAYASAPNSTTSTGHGDIFSWMHLFLPLIYTGASLDWRFGRGSICYTAPADWVNNLEIQSRYLLTMLVGWLIGCFFLRHINLSVLFNAELSHFVRRLKQFRLVWE